MSIATAIKVPPAPIATLVEILAIAGRRTQRLRRAPGRLVGVTMNPLVTMIALGYLFSGSMLIPGSANYQEYIFAGVALQVGLAGIGPTAIVIAMDLRAGLMDRFRSLPISRSAVLVGNSLGDLVMGVVGLVIVAGLGVLFGWRTHTGILPTLAGFALVIAFIYTMVWVGVLLGMQSRNMETIESLAGIVAVVFSFFSNAFLAVEKLPAWIRPLAEWNPVSAVVSACRQLWGNPATVGTGFSAQHPSIVIIVSLGAVLAVTSLLSLRRYRTAAF